MKMNPESARINKRNAGRLRNKKLQSMNSVSNGRVRKKKSKKRYLLIGLIILFLVPTVCGGFYYFRSSIIKQFIPKIRLVGDINIDVIDDTSVVKFKVLVKNETFLSIKLDTLKYSISLLNKKYIENTKHIGLMLNSNSSDTVLFSLKIPYSTILADLKKERMKLEKIGCDIRFLIGYETFLGKSEFPFKTSVQFQLIQPPELEIRSVHYTKLGLKKILADASIVIVNHSGLNIVVKEMSYYMNIYEMGNLSGYYGLPIKIGPHETTVVALPITINVDQIGKILFAILINNDNYNYTLALNAVLESVNPLKRSFNLSVTKSGQMELRKNKTSYEKQEEKDIRNRIRQLRRENRKNRT